MTCTVSGMPVAFLLAAPLLWWRYDSLRMAIAVSWLPAGWGWFFIMTTSAGSKASLGASLFLPFLGSVLLWSLTQLLLRRLGLENRSWAHHRPTATRSLRKTIDAGPLALAKAKDKRYPQPTHFLARGPMGKGLLTSRQDTHTLALGPARSGKTSSVITPNAMAWTAGSAVIVSTKLDVLFAAGPARATLGDVYLLDVLEAVDATTLPETVQVIRWTPLRGCAGGGGWDTARARSTALMGSLRGGKAGITDAHHWATQGERVLAPVLFAAAAKGLTMRVVKQWVASAEALRQPLAVLDDVGTTSASAREAADQLRGVLEQEPRSRASVIASVATALHPYAGRVLDEASAATDADWNPETFLSGRNTLFVIAPMDSEVDDPAPIVLGVMAEMYGAVRRLSDRNGGRLPCPTLWALDEVANICPIPRLPQWMAEAAGRGLSMILGAQDYAQLADRWGAEGAKAMWSNLSNKVVFPGISNPDTLIQLEALAGKKWIDQTAQSAGHTSGRHGTKSQGTTTSQVERPRWPQTSIYGLQQGTCLIFRPEDPEPLHRWQSRAHTTDPFAAWTAMAWPEPTAKAKAKAPPLPRVDDSEDHDRLELPGHPVPLTHSAGDRNAQ